MDGEPSPKRRRFFKEDGDEQELLPMPPFEPAPTSAPAEKPPLPKLKLTGMLADLSGIVGENVPLSTLKVLADISNGNLERAVNMYFDGSWRQHLPQSVAPVPKRASPPVQQPTQTFAAQAAAPPQATQPRQKLPKRRARWHRKYIGSFGVEGYAASSGSNLIKGGEAIRLERQKLSTLAKGRGNSPSSSGNGTRKLQAKSRGVPHRLSGQMVPSSMNTVVRFVNMRGFEIGRLPKEMASVVAPLIDGDICEFEGTCIYAPETLRTGQNILLQLHCYVLFDAFAAHTLSPEEQIQDRPFHFENESEDERRLRLRRHALLKILDEVHLEPVQTNDVTRQHKRAGLWEAAQMADHFESARAISSSQATPPLKTDDSDEAEEGQELDTHQLDALYAKAQQYDFNMPCMDPADTFAFDLRKYQKQALHWMVNKERADEESARTTNALHPLWEEFMWPTQDADGKTIVHEEDDDKFYLNPYSSQLSLEFQKAGQDSFGGILADEMGLGKTIEVLSLVHTNKCSESDMNDTMERTGGKNFASRTTLVIAPMSLLSQWHSEAQNSAKPGTLKSLVYYGADKLNIDIRALCCGPNAAHAPDVIITSYGTLLSEWGYTNGGQNAPSGLFSVEFYRVVLDEAHSIKNRASKTARSCYAIKAQRRWALTGTPIINKLEDLYSLVHYLRVEPWGNFSFWRTFITVPFENKEWVRALDIVQSVLEPIVLRRTKDMKDADGQPIVPLPGKTIIKECLELSPAEREIYDYVFVRAKNAFAGAKQAGTIFKNFTGILTMLLRLRQSVCHPKLVKQRIGAADLEESVEGENESNAFDVSGDDVDLQSLISRYSEENDQNANVKFGANVIKQILDEAEQECPICCESIENEAVTPCWHMACKECITGHIQYQRSKGEAPLCHTCRKPISEGEIYDVIRHPPVVPGELPEVILRRAQGTSSAKLDALLGHLKTLRKTEPMTKSVVFSQFTSFLDLIEARLRKEKFTVLRLDGTTSQKNRAAVLENLRSHEGGLVLLISLKAGGVGLNLVSASRVFMMDPWWSFAIEAQAIDRIHRMGQERDVTIVRFIVKNSVEEKMLKIQERKNFVASSLGMSKEDKKAQTMQDIMTLFED
ncbi:hypothetical protein G7K_0125-t1 [Saitoella complicata NRRL Y-17804]|uniref:DNA repair protein RAD5 n=2 Tax=Saitoella complicata (strain BCRC 22490 / CBS 7301 / JCM 7358 / NBRC 10748 / NRRL Y-17804) TaxID=698492 RepID=A0A0E9N7T2_SAICN|nr:hypothetical protein G7K_0125-t1 [Saitoella complicata NRRL Y-17804]